MSRMTKPDPALTKSHVEAAARLYGSGERWPSITVEIWLAKRLGDRTVFEGATTAEERRERIRQRIVADGRQDEIAGKRAADGVEETFAELFARLWGVPL